MLSELNEHRKVIQGFYCERMIAPSWNWQCAFRTGSRFKDYQVLIIATGL